MVFYYAKVDIDDENNGETSGERTTHHEQQTMIDKDITRAAEIVVRHQAADRRSQRRSVIHGTRNYEMYYWPHNAISRFTVRRYVPYVF